MLRLCIISLFLECIDEKKREIKKRKREIYKFDKWCETNRKIKKVS